MAIDIDEFEKKSGAELADTADAERVLRFLARNDDRAFEAAEITERASVDRNALGNVLCRLEGRGLVRHEGPYWAITGDDQRLASLGAYSRTTSALNERLGEEDPDEWAAHAPDEPRSSADPSDS